MHSSGSRSVITLESSLEDLKSAAEAECSRFAHEEIPPTRTHPRVLVGYSVFEGPYADCADSIRYIAMVNGEDVHLADALNKIAAKIETAQKNAVPVLSGSITIEFSQEWIAEFDEDEVA
jgi:hypothetical protein